MSLNHDNMAAMMNQGLTISLSVGGTSAFWGFLSDFADPLTALAAVVMALVAVGTFMVTWYFKVEANRREQQAHIKKHGPIPDKIEGTDNA